jgi:hypothetical protein
LNASRLADIAIGASARSVGSVPFSTGNDYLQHRQGAEVGNAICVAHESDSSTANVASACRLIPDIDIQLLAGNSSSPDASTIFTVFGCSCLGIERKYL